MAKIEDVNAGAPDNATSSHPTSPNEQPTLNQSMEAQTAPRPESPKDFGLDAPRIPSLDLEPPPPDTLAAASPGPPMSPEPVFNKQPEAKEELQLGPLVPLDDLSRTKTRRSSSSLHKEVVEDSYKRPRGAKRRACGGRFMRWSYVAFVCIGRALLILGVGLAMVVMVAFTASLSFGSAAANGAVWMLVGNAILRATHHAGYIESDRVVAIVGAVGCIFSAICIGIVINFLPRTSRNSTTGEAEHSWIIRSPAMVCVGALAGPIGVSILKKAKFDLEGFDVLHAARAGALGATVMGPAMLLLLPMVFLLLGILLSPLWVAMSMGLEFMYAKTNETISEDGWYKYSACVCVGSCRDDPDPEIQEQWAKAEAMRHNVNQSMV